MELVVAILDNVEEGGLDLFRDRAWMTFADGDAIDGTDGRDLRRRSGEEHFLDRVQHFPRYVHLDDRISEFARERHHRRPRHTRE